MSCSLTYDDVLSRVRITADSLCVSGAATIVDTYSRTAASGWGAADTGQSWVVAGGSVVDYSVSGGFGRINATTEGIAYTTLLPTGSPDLDYTVTVASDKLAAGNSQALDFTARYSGPGDHYFVRVTFTTTASVTAALRKRSGGVETTIVPTVTVGTHVANERWSVRMYARGSSIKCKVWLASTTEPDAWTCETTDTSVTVGTDLTYHVILPAGTSNEPILFTFDELRTRSATYATVDRSINDVNYTVVRGATEVPVTTGCELARTVDDYEFPVGELITYRTRSYDSEGVLLRTYTCQITVNLDDVWIKSIGRPFLNQRVNCVLNPSPIVRRARNGIFPIVGRSYPVGVTDVRGAREVTVRVVTQTTEERNDMDLLLASGDTVFYHTPANHPLPTMYAVIEDTVESRPVRNRECNNDWRLYELPSVEVAAPSADVTGALGTWQTVVNTYATWADVLAAHSSWADLLELVGDGSEVIVP